jgi:hypothetical protein
VEGIAIGFGDEASVAPEEVDLQAADQDVDLRRGDAVAAAEPQEEVLELAAGEDSLLGGGFVAERLGLPTCLSVVGRRHTAAKVGEGAGEGGDGDGGAGGAVSRGDRGGAVDSHARAFSAAALGRHGYVDGHGRGTQEAPEAGGAEMAEEGAIAAGEDRCEPARLRCEGAVADGVNAAMEAMETLCGDLARDSLTGEAGGKELGA